MKTKHNGSEVGRGSTQENSRKGTGFFSRLLAPKRYEALVESRLAQAESRVVELQAKLADANDETNRLAAALENEKTKNLKITDNMRKQIEIYASTVIGLTTDIKRCKNVMKYANDYIMVLNFDLVAIEISDSYRKLGYDSSDLVGISALNTIHSDDLQMALDALKKGIANAKFDFARGSAPDETGEVDIRIRKKDGSYIMAHVSGSVLLNEEGEPAGVIVVSRDITKRKEAETRLQEAHEELTRFVRVLGHDLRTPFNGILGFLDLLTNGTTRLIDDMKTHGMKTDEAENLLEMTGIVKTTAKGAFNTMNELMTLGTLLRSGAIKPMKMEIPVRNIVETNMATLSATNRIKQIVVENGVPKELCVYADLTHTSTIIRNLISNAIKFTKPGGKIEISAVEKGGFVEVVVSDNGVGISGEAIEKLFRLDGNYTTNGTNNEKGTGFGLMIVKSMVELNGGKVWVESEVDVGTKMHFTLPAYVESASETDAGRGE